MRLLSEKIVATCIRWWKPVILAVPVVILLTMMLAVMFLVPNHNEAEELKDLCAKAQQLGLTSSMCREPE